MAKKSAKDDVHEVHRKRVEDVLRTIVGKKALEYANAYDDHYEAHLSRECDITFAMLEQISQVFGTKRINFKHEQGWGGSDVTGPEPDKLWLWIDRVEGVLGRDLEEPSQQAAQPSLDFLSELYGVDRSELEQLLLGIWRT